MTEHKARCEGTRRLQPASHESASPRAARSGLCWRPEGEVRAGGAPLSNRTLLTVCLLLACSVPSSGCGRDGDEHGRASCDAVALEFLERQARLGLGAREIWRRGVSVPGVDTLRDCVVHANGAARVLAAEFLVLVALKELPSSVAREFHDSPDGALRFLAVASALSGEQGDPPLAAGIGWGLLLGERDAGTRRAILSEFALRRRYRSQRTMIEALRRELLLAVDARDKLTMEHVLQMLTRLVPAGPRTSELSRDEAQQWSTWLHVNVNTLAWDMDKRVFALGN